MHTHTHTASGSGRQNQENNRFGHEEKMIRRKKKSLETDSSQVYRKLWNKEHRHLEVEGNWAARGREWKGVWLEGRSVHYLYKSEYTESQKKPRGSLALLG